MAEQFLTFRLESSQYAVNVGNVQEVLEFTDITKVPCSASYVEGIINSRGHGISVVNLRKKFGIKEIPPSKETRIIVLEIHQGNEIVIFGAIADSVQEVIDISDTSIEPSPKFGNSIAAQFIKGIGKCDEDKFVIILNVDQIFSTDEIINLEKAAAALTKESLAISEADISKQEEKEAAS